jgi:ketosteroid isomerase-like protein
MPVTDELAIIDVADRLFEAIEQSDVALIEELWNDDIAVWHSGDPKDNDYRRAHAVICWFINRTSTRRYEILDRRVFEGGFVQQHILHATATGGATIALRVGIIVVLGENGLISRIDEYFDPRDMAPLL